MEISWPIFDTMNSLQSQQFPFHAWFVTPTCRTSASTPIQGLIECLIHHYGTLHNITSYQETYFIATEIGEWPRTTVSIGHMT